MNSHFKAVIHIGIRILIKPLLQNPSQQPQMRH